MNWSPSIILHVSYPAELALTPAELAARLGPLLPACDVAERARPDGGRSEVVVHQPTGQSGFTSSAGIDFVPPGESPWGTCDGLGSYDPCPLCGRHADGPPDGTRRWLEVYSGPEHEGGPDPHLDGLAFDVVEAIGRALPGADGGLSGGQGG